MVDKQGRLFSRVSIVDIAIIVAVLALGIGFAYRQFAPRFEDVLRPEETFYVTFEVNRMRGHVTDEVVVVGESLFRQHNRQALGRIVDVERFPATSLMTRIDGTAIQATMEDRYMLHITIEATGSVNETGYLANGNDHIAPGAEVVLINSRVIFPVARVLSVGHER